MYVLALRALRLSVMAGFSSGYNYIDDGKSHCVCEIRSRSLHIYASGALLLLSSDVFVLLHGLNPVRLGFAGAAITPDFNTIMHAFAHPGGCSCNMVTAVGCPAVVWRCGTCLLCCHDCIPAVLSVLAKIPFFKTTFQPVKHNITRKHSVAFFSTGDQHALVV